MGPLWKGVFGLGAAPGGAPAEEHAAALRDDAADQLVTLAWGALLIGQEWARRVPDPWPVTAMGLVAAGYALWRLRRLVPLLRAARASSLPPGG